MASIIYMSALDDAAKGNINYALDAFKVMLVSSAYTPNAAHAKRSDITDEVSGTGYSAGGSAVAVAATKDMANKREDVSLGGAAWAGATLNEHGAVYYKSRGGAPTADELVAYIDFLGDVISTNGTFTLSGSILRSTNRSI
jgi:hypothetical protein